MYTNWQRLMAAMSLDAYRPTKQNKISPAPLGWVIDGILSRANRGDGFDATVFHSGSGQVVIAFRGTDVDSFFGNLSDWDDDILIAKGDRSEQVEHALEIVAETMKKYPGAEISFTGHSLGGGPAPQLVMPIQIAVC